MPIYDAIIVPGGGLRPDGDLPPWVVNRLDRAAARLPEAAFVLTLSGGTPYKPPPCDGEGWPIFESVAAARYLAGLGVDPQRILTETSSYDTVGNAYFSRVIHAEPRRLTRLLIITSAFHMARTEAAFRWVYGLAGGLRFELAFEAVPDVGLNPKQLAARVAKEQNGLARLEDTRCVAATLRDFHRWLFAEHDLYAAARNGLPRPVAEKLVLDSY